MEGQLQTSDGQPSQSTALRPDRDKTNFGVPNESRYGWKWTPGFLQFLNSPNWATVLILLAVCNQGIICNGILKFFVPHIERRFELNSLESSYIISAFDIGSLLLLMPISYYGSRPGAHRPIIVGHGAIVLGTGSMVFSLPAYLTGPYHGEAELNLCRNESPKMDREPLPNQKVLYSLLLIGNLLHGIGAAPMTTLSLTYMDDSVPTAKAPLYIGAFYGMAIVGPAIGFGIGGVFARYLNVDSLLHVMTSADDQLTPDSPRWVGSWWLGFVIFGSLFYPIGTLICGLPKVLKGTKELIEYKRQKAREDSVTGESISVPTITSFKKLPYLLWYILKNYRFDLLTIAGCCDMLLLIGLMTHIPKILEQQFNLSQLEISYFIALLFVPPSLLGLGIGALIMRIYQLEMKGTLLLCTCLMSVASVFILGLALHCPPRSYNEDLPSPEPHFQDTSFLDKECNKGCNCDPFLISPVCGLNNISYFSPCYAGCEAEKTIDSVRRYSNCRCVEIVNGGNKTAVAGACPKSCHIVYVAVIAVFLYQLIVFTGGVPAITASLRCVDPEFRSLSLALQWICLRLLGAIPGPIILGNLIDHSCVLWNFAKGVRGSCLLYDHFKLGLLTASVCSLVKLFQSLIFFIAYILERKRLKRVEVLRLAKQQTAQGNSAPKTSPSKH